MAGKKSDFDSLIAELAAETEDLAKALPAADDAGEGDDEAEGEGEGAAEGEDDGDGESVMGKSIKVTDADGNEHDAVDVAPLLKALGERIDGSDATLAKALDGFAGVIRAQGKMLKALTGQVSALSSQGRGRKTMVHINERRVETPMRKGEGEGMKPAELLLKSEEAFGAGRINGLEVAIVEANINARTQISPELMRRVLGA